MSGSLFKSQLTSFVRAHGDFSDGAEDQDGNFYKSPSIRRIQRNLVKDRAGRFESNDLISEVEQRSDKVVMASNLRSAKSLGNLNNVGLSTRPEKSYQSQISAASSRSPKILSDKEVAADIVSKRLSMFENLSLHREIPAKPTVLPKPKHISNVEADSRLPLNRSKSNDPVSTSTRLELSVQKMTLAKDSVLVKDPAKFVTPKQVCFEERVSPMNKVDSNAVGVISLGSDKRIPSDVLKTELLSQRKSINPVPPPKPPRAIAVQQPSTAPKSSYGLMVYAVSPTEVRVEKIDPDAVTSSSVSKSQGQPCTSGMLSSPSSQSAVRGSPNLNKVSTNSALRGIPTFSGTSVHSPRSVTHSTNSPSGGSPGQLRDVWDKKFIRSPTAVMATHAQGKGRFVKKSIINNPNYMMVDARSDATLSSRLAVDDIAVRPLVRHGSSEMLNSTTQLSYFEEPAYADPDTLIFPRCPTPASAVEFDSAGYALPNQVSAFAQPPALPPKESYVKNGVTRIERQSIKDKVSSAYSILHLNFSVKDGAEVVTASLDDSDVDIDLEEHQRRLRHVSRVKEATFKSATNYEKVKLSQNQRLFEYALIVDLEADGVDVDTGLCRYKPHVVFSFPSKLSASDLLTCHFCFPEADQCQPAEQYDCETFSFLLTDAEGGRKYGWCSRYLPAGDGPRLPEALCIVSKLGESAMYNALLQNVNLCRGLSLECAQEMLQVAYARPLPKPNGDVYIRTMGPDFNKLTFVIRREVRPYFSNLSFGVILNRLSVDHLIQVFAAILLERKIIFCSKQLSILSSCMATMVALLYPFEWQHTYITVLPSMLLDVVDAPTPYIVGVLSSMQSLLDEHELYEVLVVDLDEGCLRSKVGDEGRVIPKKIQKAISMAISDEADTLSVCIGGPAMQGPRDTIVAEAFLRMFIETCGHYDSFINTQQNGENIFQRELFVKAVSSRSISMFLEWFTQTQMFEVFIMDKLKEDNFNGLFERRVLEYREEMLKIVNPLRDMKVLGKKIVGFFRDYGEKVKKSFNKNVYV